MVSVSFVLERTMSMLTVRECSSMAILRIQWAGAEAEEGVGTHVMVPAAHAPAAVSKSA